MSESDVVIRVEGLGKKYALHHEKAERYTALRDVVARQARAAGRLLNPFTLAGQLRKAQRQAAESGEEEFWALKDVSFEIRRGERVGIIGRNGAGKSTLLKILSRITEPTTGRVEIRGRVASLLEVGTGFHPELTGRENIYLNGAILGMTRREIRSKFDEIVDFAEVEKFLDTPVKRYSSGMYVRLAFAVAAHLEPEILVVDEVLAVGDASFQKKCLAKLQSISSSEDRSILFVSHQLQTVQSLCQRGLFLSEGSVKYGGDIEQCLKEYLGMGVTHGFSADLTKSAGRKSRAKSIISGISIKGNETGLVRAGSGLAIDISFNPLAIKEHSLCNLAFTFETFAGQRVFSVSTWWTNSFIQEGFNESLSQGRARCTLSELPLLPGSYFVNVGICSQPNEFLDHVEKALLLEVLPSGLSGAGNSLPSISQGPLLLSGSWS